MADATAEISKSAAKKAEKQAKMAAEKAAKAAKQSLPVVGGKKTDDIIGVSIHNRMTDFTVYFLFASAIDLWTFADAALLNPDNRVFKDS